MIHLQVLNKKISVVEPLEDNFPYVSCNASYKMCVTFDEEWKAEDTTIRFIHKCEDGSTSYADVSLDSDSSCTIPLEMLIGCGILFVGAYSGDTITSNSLRLYIRKSIKDMCSTESERLEDIAKKYAEPYVNAVRSRLRQIFHIKEETSND